MFSNYLNFYLIYFVKNVWVDKNALLDNLMQYSS